MLYEKGEPVAWKKWFGHIRFVIAENKSYIVTLHDYRNYQNIDKQINENELYSLEQMKI